MRHFTVVALGVGALLFSACEPQPCIDITCDPGFLCSEASGSPVCLDTCGNGILDVSLRESCDASSSDARGEFCSDVCEILIGVGCGDGTPDPSDFCLSEPSSFSSDASPPKALDFDQDGDQDILFTSEPNGEDPKLTLMLNDGLGRFLISKQISVRGAPSQFADVNGDGRIDVFLADNTNISLALQDAQGHLQPPIPNAAQGFLDVLDVRAGELGDINNDGKVDLLSSVDGGFGVLLGSGQGGFSAPSLIQGATDVAGLGLLQDWDGDNDLDWVALQEDQLTVFTNTAGSFTAGTVITSLAPQTSNKIDAQDWDGDGDQDLMVGTFNDGLQLFINNAGAFTAQSILTGPSDLSNGVVGDFNGDGDPDLLLTFGGNPLGDVGGRAFSIFENDGAGQLTETFSRNLPASVFPRAKDLNGDGLDDLLFLSLGDLDFAALAPAFTPKTLRGNILAGEYADINGDGFLDRINSLLTASIEKGGND